MSKILNTTNFVDQLQAIGSMDWDVGTSRGAPVLAQTKRNQVRAELVEGYKAWLEQQLQNVANVYLTNEGIAIEIDSVSVGEKVPEGNGFITLMLDLKFKDLSYDAMSEADDWEAVQVQKRETKLAREAAKAAKVQKAKERREAQQGLPQ